MKIFKTVLSLAPVMLSVNLPMPSSGQIASSVVSSLPETEMKVRYGNPFAEESKVIDLTATADDTKPESTFVASGQDGHGIKNKIVRHAPDPVGVVFDLPYFEDFSAGSSFDYFMIVDANRDNTTWRRSVTRKFPTREYDYYALCVAPSQGHSDDWLITPSIAVRKGHTYRVSFVAKSGTVPETMEVKWGRGRTVEYMTNTLVEKSQVNGEEHYNLTFTPESDRPHCLGFHALTDSTAWGLGLIIDSISVVDLASPEGVTNVKAVSADKGELKVTLSFTLPVKAVDGSDLNSLDSVVVSSGNRFVGKISSPAVGSDQVVVDEHAVQNENEYTIIAYNSVGAGRPVTISAYAGVDVPSTPLVYAYNGGNDVLLRWQTSAANKGYIDPSSITYSIYNISSDGTSLEDSITTVTGINETRIPFNPNQGEQKYKFWGVQASNAAGKSSYGANRLLIGAPYTLPFSNSFKNETLEGQYFSQAISSSRNCAWVLSSNSSDNDGGCIEFITQNSGFGYFRTGKINLSGALYPKLTFKYSAKPSTPASIGIELITESGDTTIIWNKDLSKATEGGWQKVTMDLPATLATEKYIRVGFYASTKTSLMNSPVYFDDIHVSDPLDNDAEISLLYPAEVSKGQTVNIDATLSNMGLNKLSGLEMKISLNDSVAVDTVFAKTLEIYDEVALSIPYKTTSLYPGESLSIKAEVIDPNDLNEDNNTVTGITLLRQSSDLPPANLRSANGTSQDVSLTWDAPDNPTVTVTDDFDGYQPWAVSGVGDWDFVNRGSGVNGRLTSNGTEPNIGSASAFEVWSPTGYFIPGQGLDPHSGGNCLAAVYKVRSSGSGYVAADDWLISPELSGQSQTISFWVNNMKSGNYGSESYQVLSSSSDKETTSFKQIGADYTQSDSAWRQVSVELPEGARYFAIRRNTNASDQLIFFLDDITYTAGRTPVSYNVYRDGKLAGSTGNTGFSEFVAGDATHVYSVTAVYIDGCESLPVQLDVTTGINDVSINTGNIKSGDIYTLDGILVRKNAAGTICLPKGIYIINGKKTVVL